MLKLAASTVLNNLKITKTWRGEGLGVYKNIEKTSTEKATNYKATSSYQFSKIFETYGPS